MKSQIMLFFWFRAMLCWESNLVRFVHTHHKFQGIPLPPLPSLPGFRYQKHQQQGTSGDGTVVRALTSHKCGLGLIPRLSVMCGLSLLVLILAPRGFSPGTPVFSSPQKPTLLNSNFIWRVSLYP